MTKVKFIRDFSPRKKDEVVELETKLADYYISLGVAKVCDCEGKTGKPCADCEKSKKETKTVAKKKKKE